METVLQIIKYFKFIKENKKSNKVVLHTSTLKPPAGSKTSSIAPKALCKNQEYIDKGLTTHYIDWCWIKHPKLRQKYALN